MANKIEDAAPALTAASVDPVTLDGKGPVERKVALLLKTGDTQEQIQYLLHRAKDFERTDQRDDDVANDHGIRLFARQKNRGVVRICVTLFLLTVIYGIQLVALYNLNRSASMLDTNVLVKWLERGLWSNPAIAMDPSETLTQRVRAVLNGSETSVFDIKNYGFCLTAQGRNDVAFNVFVGLVMIYLFLFFDVWFVVFDMPLTRNYTSEKHGYLMLFGVFWLVLINSAVITWLGVISGFAVIANSGDFYNVLFQSLQLFIILVIDDTVLPAVRFMLEEAGKLDEFGDLREEELFALTHGSQYYKPGYGHNFVRLWRNGDGCLRKLLAVLSFIVMVTIVVVPAGVTVAQAVDTLVLC